VIADGVHLHDIAIRLAARVKGPGRLVLVSDAMAAAGMPDGSYRLGSMRVTVSGGVARLRQDPALPGPGTAPGPGAIAGSTATLADVVRHAIAAGLPVPDVAAAASTNPARILGLADRTGALRPGLAADLIVCGADFRPHAVMRRGEWLAPPAAMAMPGNTLDR
jgi:N-acetylglucosamine-6-phosphate deacetylase